MFLLLLKRREVKVCSGRMSPALQGGAGGDGVSLGEQHFVICPGIIWVSAVFETHPLFSENQ